MIDTGNDIHLRTSLKRRYLRRLHTLQMEGFRLYQPLPLAAEFHASKAKIRVARGANRASKTLTCLEELIRAVCRADPYDKFPPTGNALVVAKDADNIADLWQKMTREGEIKMIRDEISRKWRAVRYDRNDPCHLDPYDAAYMEQWRDAPPLLPSRMYGSPAWEDAGKGVPRVVRLSTGWRILFRSSNGDPQQGAHYNAVMFDEQLLNEAFFIEARRGIVAINEPKQHIPRMWWSATAQVTNPQLQDLCEAAEAGAKHINQYKFLVMDNPYISDEEKQEFYKDIPPDERLSRWEGEFALTGKRIYGVYQPMGVHGCEPFPIDPTWARYIILDPGTENCATLFVAVPPDERHVYVYDGVVVHQSNLTKWASEVYKVGSRHAGYSFEAAVCDYRAGKQHQMGLNVSSTAEEYWKALSEAKVSIRTQASVRSMGGFFPGSDNVDAREQNLLKWMDIRGHGPFAGTAKLQIMRGILPELDHQIKRAHIDPKTRKRAKDNKVGAHDLLDALEYAAAFDPGYNPPSRIFVGKHTATEPSDITTEYRRRHGRTGRSHMELQ